MLGECGGEERIGGCEAAAEGGDEDAEGLVVELVAVYEFARLFDGDVVTLGRDRAG